MPETDHSIWGHVPVLYIEVLDALDPRPGAKFIDATIGAGGHAEGILDRSSPDGQLLGFDADPAAVHGAARRLERFGRRLELVHRNFANLGAVATERGFTAVDGILFDLGVSSMLLDQAHRGFSFQHDAPLDMRFDPSQTLTAADLVNNLSQDDLATVLRQYGEEPRAKRVARSIVMARDVRPLTTTLELARIVSRAAHRSERMHPATLTFQALRIAVNQELANLAQALPQAVALLKPGGRLAVISFHSLEDRIVKRFFADLERGCICPPKLPVCVCSRKPQVRVITRRPLTGRPEEVAENPRARSAKMRVAERLVEG